MQAWRLVSEAEFAETIREKLHGVQADCVMGPGRSGAIAAVYASHILGIPFIPYGRGLPDNLSRLLIIDTATETGKTLRKAHRRYPGATVLAVYNEPPRVVFWYEARKPQRFRREVLTNRELNNNTTNVTVLEYVSGVCISRISWDEFYDLRSK